MHNRNRTQVTTRSISRHSGVTELPDFIIFVFLGWGVIFESTPDLRQCDQDVDGVRQMRPAIRVKCNLYRVAMLI